MVFKLLKKILGVKGKEDLQKDIHSVNQSINYPVEKQLQSDNISKTISVKMSKFGHFWLSWVL